MRQIECTMVALLAVASFLRPATGQEFQGPVGPWGDPGRIRLEGVTQLDPVQVTKGLQGNFHYFMASHPSAPLTGLPKSIEQHLLRGYQHAGFGEAEVNVHLDFDARQVVANIKEGRRWRAGAIRVEGPPKIRDLLQNLLAEQRAPDGASPAKLDDYGGVLEWADADGNQVDEEKPIWIPGKPAHLDPKAATTRRKRVQVTLADLGYDQAKFKSTLSTSGPHAEWHIRVDDLGPPAVVRAIETTGNLKNTREEIVAYLNLRVGTIATREFLRRVQRSLWNSARFVSSKVDIERLPEGDGVRLKIDVQEYARAPRLASSLSREEKAVMKHRYWMIHGAGSQMDLVVTATGPDGHIEAILSPVEGLSFCWWPSAELDQKLPEFAMIVTDENLAAYDLSSLRKLSGAMTNVQLNAQMTMGLNAGDPAHPFKFNFGFGFESLDEGNSRVPLTLTTSTPPVYFLAQVHEEADCSWAGPVLTMRSKRGTARINEQSGELLDYSSNPAEADEGWSTGYFIRRHAFAQRREQIAAAGEGIRNEFDGARPVSSISAFLLDTGMLSAVGRFLYGESFSDQAPQESLAVLGRLIDHGFLATADTIVNAALANDGDRFKVPSEPHRTQQFQAKHYYGFLVARAADHVFPRDSWAWTLWRESALVVTGQGQHAGTELNKLMRDERCGPSTYWLLAELLKSIGRPVEPIAQHGLRKFNRLAFIREWETALGRDLHPSVAAALTALRSLEEDDIAKLIALGDGAEAGWVRIAGQLRDATQSRADYTTADLLDGIWSTELRDRLEQRLRQLATPNRVSKKPGDGELK